MAKKSSAKSAFLEEEEPQTGAAEDIFGDAEPEPAPKGKVAGKKPAASSAVSFDLDNDETGEESSGLDLAEGFEELGADEEAGENTADDEAEIQRFPRDTAKLDPADPLAYKPRMEFAGMEKIPAGIADCFGLVTPEGRACIPETEECCDCDELQNCIVVTEENIKQKNIRRQKEAPAKTAKAEPPAAPKKAAAPAKSKSPFDEEEPETKPEPPKPAAEGIQVPAELGELHPQVQQIAKLMVYFGQKNTDQEVTFETSGENAFFVNIKGAKRFRIGKKQLEDYTAVMFAKKLHPSLEPKEWEQNVQGGVTRWGYTGKRTELVTKLRKVLGV